MTRNESDPEALVAKAALRADTLAAVRSSPQETLAAHSTTIRKTIISEFGHLYDVSVLVFAGLPDEPDIVPLLRTTWKEESGIRFVFPRVAGDSALSLHLVTTETHLKRGRFGIREPDVACCPEVARDTIDLALVPGVAFDTRSGVRLGRGRGYYDRLAGAPDFHAAPLIGVCFAAQLVDGAVPHAPHDLRVHGTVSEHGYQQTGSTTSEKGTSPAP